MLVPPKVAGEIAIWSRARPGRTSAICRSRLEDRRQGHLVAVLLGLEPESVLEGPRSPCCAAAASRAFSDSIGSARSSEFSLSTSSACLRIVHRSSRTQDTWISSDSVTSVLDIAATAHDGFNSVRDRISTLLAESPGQSTVARSCTCQRQTHRQAKVRVDLVLGLRDGWNQRLRSQVQVGVVRESHTESSVVLFGRRATASACWVGMTLAKSASDPQSRRVYAWDS